MVELKMSETNEKTVQLAPTCMVSVNRIVKLPVVESSIQTATNVYEKVKDLNGYTKWGFETFENTIQSVVETGKPYAIPVVQKLDGPIKKVDSVLCTGLDYVESKVPAVKLPPGELYTCTKGYVHDNVTPKVESACKTVHSVVDPTVEAAYKIVEPVVQPALDTAQAVKDKVEEFLHLEKNQTEAGNQAEAGPSSSADSKSDTESH
ncbi:hypothetical protein WA026_006361 [Henosepilachna vigintioctopunctata]|uniref:Uncharacterized protein n=1 Tax=Henosepilachna vigintioctopunctata TaxID=420089 RepID=A0AAW1TPC5_9CUCU